MTEQKHFVAEVHQDRTKVRLSMGKEELELNADELDILIRELGVRRAMMTPHIPMQLEPNPRFLQVSNPPWHMGIVDKQEKVMVLLLRHPAYGWIGNVLPLNGAKKLLEGLAGTVRELEPVVLPEKKLILPPGTGR